MTVQQKYETQKNFFRKTIENLFSSKTTGSTLIYDETVAETYSKGGKNHRTDTRAYGDSRDYTNGYENIMHIEESAYGIKFSVYVESAACGHSDSDEIHYSPDIAFAKLSNFHSAVFEAIGKEYPKFNKDKDIEEWGDGSRTATVFIYYTTLTVALKNILSQLKKNQEALDNFNKEIVTRIQNQKSSLKSCPNCGSKINVKFVKSVKCPCCGSNDFGYSATDKNKLERLKEVNKDLKQRLNK